MIDPLANRIITLIKQDPLRMKVLDCVSQLGLPQCHIAAGFVGNLVWDYLHGFDSPTPLNDIDVIYFDPSDTSYESAIRYEVQLQGWLPELNWQVRNQASMHTRKWGWALPRFIGCDALLARERNRHRRKAKPDWGNRVYFRFWFREFV